VFDWGFAEQSEIDKEDELIKCNEGNLVIDTSSAFYLFGTELDYVEEVFGSHFDIKNPNTKSACGCGESINFDMRV
jgi:iron-sulfur cluster assembly accessory protein